jgi:phosphate-selective porin OprO and OprP
LHSDHEEADTVLDRYDDLLSATFWIQHGSAGLVIEGFAGTGAGADAIGFYLQPTYDLLPGRVQVVGRYSFSHGDGADSVIAQSRYERSAPSLTGGGRGELYHAGYLGLQYFLHADNLKFLTGVEYARLDGGGNGGDFAGWTVFSGVRVSF